MPISPGSVRGRRLPRRSRRGNIVVYALFVLAVIFGIAALVIDMGLVRSAQMHVQNAADAAAHGAAARLDGTSTGMANAQATALELVERNPTGVSPLPDGVNPDTVVRLGRWQNGAFVEDTTNPATVTAAQVDLARMDLKPWFSAIAFGTDHLAAAAVATAVAGGPGEVRCVLPIAVPDCELPGGAGTCGYDVILNADGNDTGGWALLGSSRPNASTIRSYLDGCIDASLSNVVTLNNGTVNSALNRLADVVNRQTTYWDTATLGTQPARMARSGINPYGKVLEGEIIVFDDPANCTGTKYNGTSLPLAGFASVVIYDVATSGPVNARAVRMRISCDYDDELGGGGFFGTTVPPTLVQ